MKKILLILFIIMLTANVAIAQQHRNRQKITLLKTAFITDAINLTPKEAEKFWPIYNLYSDKIRASKMALEGGLQREIRFAGGVENLSDEQSQKIIDNVVLLEQQITDHKIKLIQELSTIISAKKIIGLKKAERNFNRRILQEYGKRRRMQGQ
ncbi:hypothetical protein JYT50_00395 [bacterium AH-315-A23]|nr:hypothetical protein [bacterium AH-315-A23]